MTKGQTYRCPNRDCFCEVTLFIQPAKCDSKPRCRCGAEMKKPYTKPVLTSLKMAGQGLIGTLEQSVLYAKFWSN
jgi:hypothetical protein